jgi:hypothetical protein
VRIIIECPERILHLEAGYIYADCPFVNFNPLAVRRRTIHFRQLHRSEEQAETLYCILQTFANFLVNQVTAKERHDSEPRNAGDSDDENRACWFWHSSGRK